TSRSPPRYYPLPASREPLVRCHSMDVDDSLPWDEKQLPGTPDDTSFTAFVHRRRTDSDHFQPAEAAVTGWDEAPNPTTHASFGDNGLTASVSAYGELMQFARYLGAGRSGVFSLDYYWTPEPSEIQA